MLNDKKFMAKVNASRKTKDANQQNKIEVKPPIYEEESSSSASDTNNLANAAKEEDSRVRKSTRIPKSTKINQEEKAPNTQETKKEVNRRTKKFKLETKVPLKSADTLVSKVASSDCVLHKGLYLKIGDIVALYDIEDRETIYFGQIRGFLSDQYANKSVCLTWLIPIDSMYKKIRYAKDFDASLFMLGPPEEFPVSLDYVEFVCRLERSSLSNGYLNKDNQSI
jgi:hypothetical protein